MHIYIVYIGNMNIIYCTLSKKVKKIFKKTHTQSFPFLPCATAKKPTDRMWYNGHYTTYRLYYKTNGTSHYV